ncbi:MAG: hypothetical protein JXA37_14810 [Chloroflexia bacterium]|nr:hypothetical protein [Chloroflexia bacterium]
MTIVDWRWKIGEAVGRLRHRYDYIGRTTGAPFLALVYPEEVERAVLKEWHIQTAALQPHLDVRAVNLLDVTQQVVAEMGAENIVSVLTQPMPGSDPHAELGRLWLNAITDAVRSALAEPGHGKPVISLERLAALFPVAGPRDVMQSLWDEAHTLLNGPVVVLIPGILQDARTYRFVGRKEEFMYRGELL